MKLLLIFNKIAIIHGLIKGNHVELFEHVVGVSQSKSKPIKFCGHSVEMCFNTTLKHIASDSSINILLDFEDQNYTIKILNSVLDDVIRLRYILLDTACRKKKYQVVEFLVQNTRLDANYILASTIVNLIMDDKIHYLDGEIGKFEYNVDFYVSLAFCLSNVKILDIVFRHTSYSLGDRYINDEILEYYKAHYTGDILKSKKLDMLKYDKLIELHKQYQPITFDLQNNVFGPAPIDYVMKDIHRQFLIHLFNNSNLTTVKTYLKALLFNTGDLLVVSSCLRKMVYSHEQLIVSNAHNVPSIIRKINARIKFSDDQLRSELQRFGLEVSAVATRIELLSLLIDNLY